MNECLFFMLEKAFAHCFLSFPVHLGTLSFLAGPRSLLLLGYGERWLSVLLPAEIRAHLNSNLGERQRQRRKLLETLDVGELGRETEKVKQIGSYYRLPFRFYAAVELKLCCIRQYCRERASKEE